MLSSDGDAANDVLWMMFGMTNSMIAVDEEFTRRKKGRTKESNAAETRIENQDEHCPHFVACLILFNDRVQCKRPTLRDWRQRDVGPRGDMRAG